MENPAAIILISIILILILWQLAWFVWRLAHRRIISLSRRLPASAAWARTHPLRALLLQRLPRTYYFLHDRVRTDRFSGLPLTLLIMAAVYLAILLAGIAEDVMANEEITVLDNKIADLIAPYRTPSLVALFAAITALGDFPAMTAVSIVASAFLWANNKLNRIPALWITIVGAHVTTHLGKYGFDRQRPDFAVDITVHTASFPSGHASASMAALGFIAYAIARDLSIPRARFEVVFWTLILIGLIGFSRVFLNVHHSSDVTAGFLVGGFWLLIGIIISEQLRFHTKK